jgi:hypothetical protein
MVERKRGVFDGKRNKIVRVGYFREFGEKSRGWSERMIGEALRMAGKSTFWGWRLGNDRTWWNGDGKGIQIDGR